MKTDRSDLVCNLKKSSAHPGAGGGFVACAVDTVHALPLDSIQTTFANESLDVLGAVTMSCTSLNQCNQQYSVTAVTTTAGAITERYAYSPYGELTILNSSATPITSSAIDNRYTYTGREWDSVLKLYHFRARMMSPVAGRFLGRDPFGYFRTANVYISLLPVQYTDPTGKDIVIGNRNDDPVYYDPGSQTCWIYKRDSCRRIIGRTTIPCVQGDSKKERLDETVEIISRIGQILGTRDAVLNPEDLRPNTIGPYLPLIDALINDTVNAIPEFGAENSPCNNWYKETLAAFESARKGDCRGCRPLATITGDGSNTNASNCASVLLLQGKAGHELSQAFVRFSQALSNSCAEHCR